MGMRGYNWGSVNRAGGRDSQATGVEGQAWSLVRGWGRFGERELWQLPPGEGLWGKHRDVQRDLMGVALGSAKGELSSLQDPVPHSEC